MALYSSICRSAGLNLNIQRVSRDMQIYVDTCEGKGALGSTTCHTEEEITSSEVY